MKISIDNLTGVQQSAVCPSAPPTPKNEAADIENDISSVINDIQPLFHTEDDQRLIGEVRQAWRLTDRDNVQIFVVPKGATRRMPFTTMVNQNHTSPRLQRLNIDIRINQGRITELEMGIADPDLSADERAGKIAALEHEKRDINRAINSERARLARLPRTGVIVVERES